MLFKRFYIDRAYLATGCLIAAFTTLALVFFGRLSLLVEYREWSDGRHIGAILDIFTLKGIAFSRSFGLFVDSLAAIVFGSNALAHNVFQITILAAAGFLLAVGLRALFPLLPPALAVASVGFLLFSTAIMDAICWQATVLDKLCLFFSALGTCIAARLTLRSSNLLFANAIFLAITVAAYNSKESSFALVPALWLLLAIRLRLQNHGPIEALRRAFYFVVGAALYAAVHVGVVLINRYFSDAVERQHELGGSIAFNFYHFAAYLLNLQTIETAMGLFPYAPPSAVMTFCSLAGLLALAAISLFLRSSRSVKLIGLWAAISFFASFLISIKAAGVAPYYMLVPQFYLSIVLCAVGMALSERIKGRTVGIVSCGLLTLYVISLAGSAGWYLHLMRMSDNVAVVAKMAKTFAQRGVKVVYFWPLTEPRSYMFFSEEANQSYTSIPNPHRDPKTAFFILGDTLRILRVIPPSR